MTPPTPLLAARGAGRRFGRKSAVEAVELELWDGDALALVGPNGAGKSTLLALLAGALEASVGKIERRKGVRVGWAPQRPAQYGRLSARENLELFARLEGEHDPRAAADRLLEAFELPGEAEPSANLSVGNRQRLNLAISLLGSPDVLLLDEPTAALDPGQRRRLWERVAALRESGGAILFATQNLEEVERVADRVAALREGRLVFAGTRDEYDRLHGESLSA
ncbi:MAG TPA: ABC transporter ATP-binding protein [Gaiellaceae bacterium]|nr:ABC transporter ATP-binding protein [Gaiellaceae bacterium]